MLNPNHFFCSHDNQFQAHWLVNELPKVTVVVILGHQPLGCNITFCLSLPDRSDPQHIITWNGFSCQIVLGCTYIGLVQNFYWQTPHKWPPYSQGPLQPVLFIEIDYSPQINVKALLNTPLSK